MGFSVISSQANATGRAFVFSQAEIEAAGIRLAPIQTKTADTGGDLRLSGTVKPAPNAAVTVSATEEATISELLIPNLSHVKAGQVVLRIYSTAFLDAQKSFLQDQSALRLARQTLERDKLLFEEGLIAQRRLQESQNQLSLHSTAEASSRQRLKILGVSAAQMEKIVQRGQLSESIDVAAPVSGQLVSVAARIGQKLMPGDVLLQVLKARLFELELAASVSQGSDVTPGDTVSVPGCALQGKVTGVSSMVDANSQSLLVRALLAQDTADCLRANQYVQVQIRKQTETSKTGGFEVPAGAIVNVGQQAWVFVKTDNGFLATQVKVLGSQNQTRFIEGNLVAGRSVATSGTTVLKAAWQGMGKE
jgi:multidrug efflux pump subunit AcrA (membrane-fusion protein)